MDVQEIRVALRRAGRLVREVRFMRPLPAVRTVPPGLRKICPASLVVSAMQRLGHDLEQVRPHLPRQRASRAANAASGLASHALDRCMCVLHHRAPNATILRWFKIVRPAYRSPHFRRSHTTPNQGFACPSSVLSDHSYAMTPPNMPAGTQARCRHRNDHHCCR